MDVGQQNTRRVHNSYLLTYSSKTLYILEVHYEFFITEECCDELIKNS